MAEFTDEEFESTDTFQQFANASDNAYIAMHNTKFAVDHSHENDSVLITTRYSYSIVDETGATLEKPQQTSLVVPSDQLQGLILELILSGLCLTRSQDEGIDPHEA